MTRPATPPVLGWIDRQLGLLAGLLALIGGIGIFALMAITVVAVVWRYGFNNPIFGISDLSVVTLTLVAGSAVAFGALRGAHISVDVIHIVAGRRVTRWTDAVARVLTVAITGLATYALFAKACGIEKACITNNFSIEHRPFFYFLGVSMGLYTAHVAVQFLIGIWNFRGTDPNEIVG